MMNRSLVTMAIVLTLGVLLHAQRASESDEVVEAQIERAMALYDRSEYTRAAELIDDIIARSPTHDRFAELLITAAKARYYAGEHERAAELFDAVPADDGGPAFGYACHYFLGRIAFDAGDYLEAAERFASARSLTANRELRQLCYSNCLSICVGYLSFSEQRSLLSSSYAADRSFFNELIYDTARKFHELGLHRRAERMLDINLALLDSGDERIRNLRDRIEAGLSRSLEIALLVPLSGELAAYGRQMDGAAKLAVSTCGAVGSDIRVKSYDTYGNSIVAAHLARDVTSAGVSAVVGPLTSHEAVGAAPYSDFWSVPMILPAASEKGLTSISNSLFQLSPTPETLGRRLAEAAVEELGLDSVAILAPNDAYARQIVDGFKQVAAADGVEIFYEVYFPRGNSDYTRFMLNMKKAVLPDVFDPAIFLDKTGDTLETEEVPVDIPAMLIPAVADELRFIIPQLRFYRINTVILGGEDLGSAEIASLDPMRHYAAMFVSRATLTEEDTSWQRFSYLFEQETGTATTPVAGLTFDAVNMTVRAAELGGFSARGIARGWEKLGKIEGVTGPFEFNKQNENTAIPVYILIEGSIEKWPY